MKKIKQRWGIRSNFQMFLILMVFAINGSLAVKIAEPLMEWIGLNRGTTTPFVYWFLRILIIFPIYQITLVIVGALFGQFRFFWKYRKENALSYRFGSFF